MKSRRLFRLMYLRIGVSLNTSCNVFSIMDRIVLLTLLLAEGRGEVVLGPHQQLTANYC